MLGCHLATNSFGWGKRFYKSSHQLQNLVTIAIKIVATWRVEFQSLCRMFFCFVFFFHHKGKDCSYIVEGLGPSKSDHPLIPLSSPTVHIATEPLQKSGMCQDWIGMFHWSLPTYVMLQSLMTVMSMISSCGGQI